MLSGRYKIKQNKTILTGRQKIQQKKIILHSYRQAENIAAKNNPFRQAGR